MAASKSTAATKVKNTQTGVDSGDGETNETFEESFPAAGKGTTVLLLCTDKDGMDSFPYEYP